jgi:LytS/YehU family sensor histidine kinase
MYFQNAMIERNEDITIAKAISANLFLFVFIFIHNHFLVSKLLLQRKLLQYAIAVLIHFTIVNLFVYRFGYLFGKPINIPLPAQIITMFMVHLIGVAFFFLHLSILQYLQKQKTKSIHSQTEINFLKQQLNPHFLLNALNNLYGVALSTPHDIPDKILELSDLLKYQINTSKKDWIALQEEMDFITQYFEYIKWKSNDLKITSTTEGDFQNFQISPMVFLPLIENAVKYSAQVQAPIIAMQWVFTNDSLQFSITNNYDETKTNLQSTKMGIDNLQKRLAIYHPQNELQLLKNNNTFTAELKLWKLSTVA